MKTSNILQHKFLPIAMLCLCMSQPGNGQDFKRLVTELRKKYESADKLHVVMDIQVFENSKTTTPYFTEHADIKREGTDYRYQMQSNELLMNDQYLVMVDRNSKEILCSRRDRQAEAGLPDPFKMNIDSMFNIIGQPKFIGKSEGRDHYRLSQTEGLLEQIDLFVNTDKSFMQQIEYRYRDGQVASIKINVFDIAPQFASGTFNETYYVLRENGKFTTSAAYRGYRIITEGED
jgi:hypothetical protein